MGNFIGIDLGTTNSAIGSCDGIDTRIWKSPEQNDVTPSALYIGRRGGQRNIYVGAHAYNAALRAPGNVAQRFKRLMGTNTPVRFAALDLTLTPEECSAEILKALFGYLPEEMRRDPEIGTVITVPAAFNQMKKSATVQAAEAAGLGMVELVQEPVAAVLRVAQSPKATEGMLLVYDLGGGTFDVTVAENLEGHVSLLATGGIEICGGRDFDRALVNSVLLPWLQETFRLPMDLTNHSQYNSLMRMAHWATEKAKIALSAQKDTLIQMDEGEIGLRDLSGEDIFFECPLNRSDYNRAIAAKIDDTVEAVQGTLDRSGFGRDDIDAIVFVGGPTNYKPLRDRVVSALDLVDTTDQLGIDRMTAVAEGAGLYAASHDWSTHTRASKSARGQTLIDGALEVTFHHMVRTTEDQARITVQGGKIAAGYEFQVVNRDDAWSSGRMPLVHDAVVEVDLSRKGDNTFEVQIFKDGSVLPEKERIVIFQAVATVDSIPASHSISIEALERIGSTKTVPEYLVREGDSLPAKGSLAFKAYESLKAGSSGTLNFKVWEGAIEDPVSDNNHIGLMKIAGTDFDDGVISAGDDLICDYEMKASGQIVFHISIPSIGATFSEKNFYARQEGQRDYTSAADLARIKQEAEETLRRVVALSQNVSDPRLLRIQKKLEIASALAPDETDTEVAQEANEHVLESRRMLGQIRKEHHRAIGQFELEELVSQFNRDLRDLASPTEVNTFENLQKTTQRSIDRQDRGFERFLEELQSNNFDILWRQPGFLVAIFENMLQASPHLYSDPARFQYLAETGVRLIQNNDFEGLQQVLIQLANLRIDFASGASDISAMANIVRG